MVVKTICDVSGSVIDVLASAPDAVDSVVALAIKDEPVVSPLSTVDAKAVASAVMSGNEAANALDGTAAKRWRAPANAKSAWRNFGFTRLSSRRGRLLRPTTANAAISKNSGATAYIGAATRWLCFRESEWTGTLSRAD
jgi:hypothetical protein